MFKQSRSTTAQMPLAVLAVTGILLLNGCGGTGQPLQSIDPSSPSQTAVTQADAAGGAFVLDFSPGSPVAKRAAKPPLIESISGWFTPNTGGNLVADFSKGHIKRVKFKVEPWSIDESHEISMVVYRGPGLEHTRIAFSPSGLAFVPPARLIIILDGSLTKTQLSVLAYYHTTSDGTVTKISGEYTRLKTGEWRLMLKVPGFSRYSLGGGD